jgi:hypothetical protein
MQTHRPVPPPSLSLGDRYRRGHAAIDAFVVKACAKEPGVRFPNARAMKTAMLRLITLI